jgi:hypothetical protein
VLSPEIFDSRTKKIVRAFLVADTKLRHELAAESESAQESLARTTPENQGKAFRKPERFTGKRMAGLRPEPERKAPILMS